MDNIRSEILKRFYALQDLKYKEFQSKLLPTIPQERIIGVRTPALRAYARELCLRADIETFLCMLPHNFFDENQLHAFILSAGKDYEATICAVNAFLPYVDNWATCDQLSPHVFRRHRKELIGEIRRWVESEHLYTVRFGIGMLMQHYLDEEFSPEYLTWVSSVQREEYYVKMMVAWYFATALAKQYQEALPYLEQHWLETWTHNKTIQKAIESYRIGADQKEYLRSLKIAKKTK